MRTSETKVRPASGEAGFTLVEILIVMSVIIVLMGMVLVGVIGSYDPNRARVNADLMVLASAIESYRDAYGKVLPPGYWRDEEGEVHAPGSYRDESGIIQPPAAQDDILQSGITFRPSPSTDEEKSTALLFYFLTRTFKSAGEEDPGTIGRSGSRRGPFISRSNLKKDLLKDDTVLEEDFVVEDMHQGYSGVATWLVDPWGNPYRYVLTNDGRNFELESAGPDGEFGDVTAEEDIKRKDNISLEKLNR